jgi:hypothetical protein
MRTRTAGGNARVHVPSLPSSVATRTCVSSHGSCQFCDGNATAGSSAPMSIAETPPRTCRKSKGAQLRATRRSTCPRLGALSGASGPPAIRRLRRASTQPASERDGAGVHADNPSSAALSALHLVQPPRICVRYTNQAQLQAGKRRLLPLPPPPRRPTRDLRHAAKRRPRTPTGRLVVSSFPVRIESYRVTALLATLHSPSNFRSTRQSSPKSRRVLRVANVSASGIRTSSLAPDWRTCTVSL